MLIMNISEMYIRGIKISLGTQTVLSGRNVGQLWVTVIAVKSTKLHISSLLEMSYQNSDHGILRLIPSFEEAKSLPRLVKQEQFLVSDLK